MKTVKGMLLAALLSLSCVTMAGCTGDPAFDAAAMEMRDRTVALMAADGVTEPTPEDWLKYGAVALEQRASETAPPAEPEPSPWWVTLGDVLLPILLGGGTYKAGTLGLQTIYSLLAGRHTRATENLAKAVSPTTTLKEKITSLGALAMDTHTPKPAVPVS